MERKKRKGIKQWNKERTGKVKTKRKKERKKKKKSKREGKGKGIT